MRSSVECEEFYDIMVGYDRSAVYDTYWKVFFGNVLGMIYLFRFEFGFISQAITDGYPPVTGVLWWVGVWWQEGFLEVIVL